MSFRLLSLTLATAVLLVVLPGATPPLSSEALERHRSLGKAFYENPTTQTEAVTELKRALDLAPTSLREKLNYALGLMNAGSGAPAAKLLEEVQKLDPKLPHTWFNLGVYYRKAGNSQKAIAQFEAMLKLTPDEPIARYQLGALYRQENRATEAIAQFEQASKLNPLLAAAHFQLYTLYRQAGRAADAAAQLKTFQDLKKQQESAASPEDVDWCIYSELYDPARAVTPSSATPRYSDRTLGAAEGLLVVDSTGKGFADLLAWSASGIALYPKGGATNGAAGLGDVKSVLHVAAGDFDNDGLTDLCVLTAQGPRLYRNGGGTFAPFAANVPKRAFDRAIWVDYDHDYDLDLLLFGDSPALLRNQGSAGFTDQTASFPFAKGHVADVYRVRMVADSKSFDVMAPPFVYLDQLGGRYTQAQLKIALRNPLEVDGDFDGDGRMDKARITGGVAHLLHNETKTGSNWIRIQLAGVKSLKSGQDAEVEVKAGSIYRKAFYDGAPLSFDIGANAQADVVRITWMNGLLQSEVRLAANKTHRIEEAQRLSGSCPMIWTWNGKEFEFITDVLGVAPLGASDGDGSYFPVDHDELVSIPGGSLRPRDGAYEIRVTEELSEISYLDQLSLQAVDHPAGTEVFTNEKFQSPPFPEDRLYVIRKRMAPAARQDRGGILELDFPDAKERATLFLKGWVDWPDGSAFRARSQEKPYQFPRLEMQNVQGQWQVVNADMGMPAGKPKTIAVDLRFISASRKVRVSTDLPVHWQETFVADAASEAAERHGARASHADLHFRGFSEAKIDPQRRSPDTYAYRLAATLPFWNPTPGNYTRFGDVLSLVGEIDDRMVVMGSGDELTLRFPVDAFPQLKPGWTRDFLLKVDGWAKDRDANTAYGDSVEPLPFHRMSRYPYPATERYPDDEAHQRYLREFQTRPALRPLRPLSE